MQLAFPPLQGSNRRSVHVKTDGSQIRLFQGFLSGLPIYPHSTPSQPFCSPPVIFPLLLDSFEPVPHSYCTPFISARCQSHHFLCKLWPGLHTLASHLFALSPFLLINFFWPLINFHLTLWTAPIMCSWAEHAPCSQVFHQPLRGSQLLMTEPWHMTFSASLSSPSLAVSLKEDYIHLTPWSTQ